ncbi:cation/H(+) antiporter 14 [Lathyrus oleraceus]|uniref:Cation/H+ exchanger domain-containing protein n=1 Tax=Pisum sativum TaxID=3888 RepID=A0A9D4WXF9_PEA|nr:cation/H(+) antiporter 14-like [Pisum sativum]KAI5408490.1 hypothetical protein KIW84_054366 [Pisum sativum]
MDEASNKRLDQLTSYGMINNKKLACQYIANTANKGVWYGDNPLHATTSILVFQIILMFFVSRLTHFLLSPFHQTLLIAQILTGIIVGPLVFGRHDTSFEILFPASSIMTLSTFAEFGIIIYFFKMGVQINYKQLMRIEKRAVIIGVFGHISAIAFGLFVLSIVERISPLGSEKYEIVGLIFFGALTSCPVISNFLSEMNILSSEIGRMALSTSMVSDACMWIIYFIILTGAKAVGDKSFQVLIERALSFLFFGILYYLLRPLVIWIANRETERKSMTQGQFLCIICIILFIGFFGIIVGLPTFMTAFWFGVILPDGPPLGSILVEKLDIVGSTLIVPAYCTISGLRTSVPKIVGSKTPYMEVVIIAVYAGKFLGTILPSLHYHIEFWDSLALGLIMCCKGLMDLSMFNILLNAKNLGEVLYTLMVYTMVLMTGFASLIVYYIYDPSRRYRAYMRKSVKDSERDFDFKVLVCIHNEENVSPMIDLLQATNPTNTSPISVFVLHLMELSGRAASISTKNEYAHKSNYYKDTSTQTISNVFNKFLLHNKECITLKLFTAIAPHASMHDDICYMAMDTKSNIVIVPFHRQWSMNGTVEVSNASIRLVNQRLLNKAPCSIGVLIDRSQMSGKLEVEHKKCFCKIAMIFLGGPDDQEALAYGMRVAEHPNIRLTVIWVRCKAQQKNCSVKSPYIDMMEHIKYRSNLKDKVYFNEEVVEDGEGTTQAIRMMENIFNLVIVGRHHIPDSPCTLGMTEWCELPELGPIGNLLATSDFTFSVLVVQQQPLDKHFR